MDLKALIQVINKLRGRLLLAAILFLGILVAFRWAFSEGSFDSLLVNASWNGEQVFWLVAGVLLAIFLVIVLLIVRDGIRRPLPKAIQEYIDVSVVVHRENRQSDLLPGAQVILFLQQPEIQTTNDRGAVAFHIPRHFINSTVALAVRLEGFKEQENKIKLKVVNKPVFISLSPLPQNIEPEPEQNLADSPKPTSEHPDTPVALPTRSFRALIGRDEWISDILNALRDTQGKWIVGVDGMGGIGKTALAREVAEISKTQGIFDAIVWEESPKNQSYALEDDHGSLTFETVLDSIARQLGALDVPRLSLSEKKLRVRNLLNSRNILIILDNLETAQENQNDIASQLLTILNPSKALFTSRHRFESDVFTIHLTGLSVDNSVVFVHQEAEEKGIERVKTASKNDLEKIARTTGGSPLALKLVVGLLDRLPLNIVLEQLKEIKVPDTDSSQDDYIRFYQHIFSHSWKLLGENSKKLLISMAHFAPNLGGTYEAIQATSDLSDEILTKSINDLWRFSFLEVGMSTGLKKIRYYLHTLTQYFILSDVVKVIK